MQALFLSWHKLAQAIQVALLHQRACLLGLKASALSRAFGAGMRQNAHLWRYAAHIAKKVNYVGISYK